MSTQERRELADERRGCASCGERHIPLRGFDREVVQTVARWLADFVREPDEDIYIGGDDGPFQEDARCLLERAAAALRAPVETADSERVCLVGSSRFVDVAAVIAWEFEKRGIMALSMNLLPPWYAGVQPDHQAEAENVARTLDELHLRKIDLADTVYVVDVGGYVGERTTQEIIYAHQHDKPVRYLSDDPQMLETLARSQQKGAEQ
jgi:hypothetical protein